MFKLTPKQKWKLKWELKTILWGVVILIGLGLLFGVGSHLVLRIFGFDKDFQERVYLEEQKRNQ